MAVNIQLFQFTAKPSPVPTDLVYLADSANSYDEVQSTIEGLIGAYPGLLSIGSLTTAANEIIYTTGVDTYATSAITALGRATLALTVPTTAPTANVFTGWDANKNISANNYIPGYASTVSSASPIVLTVSSAYAQYITGSTNQTVTMPVVSTLATVASGTAQSFLIVNLSSATVTVNSSGGNLIVSLPAGSQSLVTCISNTGTSAASWSSDFVLNTAGVASATGTANQVIVSASTGAVIFSLPQSIATTSAVTFASVAFSSTSGIIGTTTNDNAAAGSVGQFVTSNIASGSATSISTTSPTTLTSISLTAGDWVVGGNIVFTASGNVLTTGKVGISIINNTFPDTSSTTIIQSSAIIASTIGIDAPQTRISISGTTTVYIIGQANFGSGTCTQCGNIWARRVR